MTPSRRARSAGRHRDGRPRVAVPRRSWDLRARTDAERLDAAWPGWVVLYGTGSRHFHAIATWQAAEPLIVSDSTAHGLERRMREVEVAVFVQRDHEPEAPGPCPLQHHEHESSAPHLLCGHERPVPYPPHEHECERSMPHTPRQREHEAAVPYGLRLP